MKKNGFTLFLLIFCQIMNVFIVLYILIELQNNALYPFLIMAAIILFAADIVLARAFYKNTKMEQIKMTMDLLFQRSQMEEMYHLQVSNEAMKLKKLSQELVGRLEDIENYISEGQFDASRVEEMLLNTGQVMQKTKTLYYCDHDLTNIILADKVEMAKSKDISVDVKVFVPEALTVSKTDICSAWCNLLDNAIEACERLEDKALRQIIVRAQVKANYLYIKVENTMDKKSFDGKYATAKRDEKNHGLGLKILKEIADRYEGNLIMEVKEGRHYSVLALLAMDRGEETVL